MLTLAWGVACAAGLCRERNSPALTWMGFRPLLMAERLGEQNCGGCGWDQREGGGRAAHGLRRCGAAPGFCISHWRKPSWARAGVVSTPA